MTPRDGKVNGWTIWSSAQAFQNPGCTGPDRKRLSPPKLDPWSPRCPRGSAQYLAGRPVLGSAVCIEPFSLEPLERPRSS